MGQRAELTIEVVQQGLLKHFAHDCLDVVCLQPWSQGDGDHGPVPARGQERHVNRDRSTDRGIAAGMRTDHPCPGFKQSPATPRVVSATGPQELLA